MLRIVQRASAGVFAITCATLIALCIRSYYWANIVVWGDSAAPVEIVSMEGRLIVSYIDRTLLGKMANLSGTMANRVDGFKTDSQAAGVISGYLRQRENRHGFGFVRGKPIVVILFPYWLPILISGMLAAVLGIERMRRFSLRFMLVLTAMVAILLGIVVSQ